MVDKKKLIKGAVGGILITAGVAAKLADKSLSAAEVVLNGAVNLADSFVNAPKLGIGKALLGGVHQGLSKFSDKLLKKGREMS
ncbi:MAG: hypothetical protein IJ019_06040 [Alphaproteobacteria bacterium]|nr:hypothetical protein [Alphaproteobacteria bacterium]